MKTAALERELAAACAALTDVHRCRLLQLGIPPEMLDFGMVGFAHVRELKGGLYELVDAGEPALITPARIDDPYGPENAAGISAAIAGELVDLVGWFPTWPDRFLLRLGTAEWLGAIGPEHLYLDPEPVLVHRGPLGWLRANGAGLVPLVNRRADVYRLLTRCVGGLVCEDQHHAEKLRRALAHPWPAPPISIAEGLRDAAE